MMMRPPKKPDPMLHISNAPQESIQTPADFLRAIGRESETKLSVDTWTEFWNMNGRAMRDAGIGTKDRRYVMEIAPTFRYVLTCNCKPDIFCGVERNIGWDFPLKTLLVNLRLRRPSVGKYCWNVHGVEVTYLLLENRWGPRVQNGKRLRSRRNKNK